MYNLSLQIIFCLAASLISASFYTMYSNKNEPKFKMALMIFISHMIILLPTYEEYKMLFDVIQIVVELLIIVFVIDNTLMNKLIMYVELNIAFGMAAILGNYLKDEKIAYLLTTLVIGAIMCYIFICWHNRNKDKKIKSFDGKIIAIILSISLLCYLYITGIVIENLNKINAFIVYLCFVYCIVAIYELLVICEKIRMNEMITRQQKVVSAINNNIKNIVDKLNEAAQTENSNIECVRNKIEELYKETANTNVYRLLFDKKCIKAKENGCKIIITGNIDEVFCDIKAFDYVTIIGNLLDNAIEAASKCATNNVIKVDISKEKIIIENAYSGELLIVDDKIQTKKTEEGHGFGLNNAKKTLLDIGKELNVIAEKGIFKVCIKSILLMFFIAGLSCLNLVDTYADEEIPASAFLDDVFYNYIMDNFDINGDGVFMESEALAVTVIEELPHEVTKIDGIEYLSNLQELYMNYCDNIEDYSPIAACTKLTAFKAEQNANLKDISFLSGKDLKVLSLYGCYEITDFSVLHPMSLVNLAVTNQTDVSYLQNYTELEELMISHSNITDFSYIENCTNLTYVYLNDVKMTDYSDIGKCTSIKDLSIVESNLTDVSFVTELVNLEYLTVAYNENLTTIPDLKGLSNLTEVYAINTGITLEEATEKLPNGVTVTLDEGLHVIEGESESEDNENNENETLISVQDENISVEGDFDENTYLEADEIEDVGPYNDMLDEIRKLVSNIYKIYVYDISLFKDIIEDGTTVKVKIQPDNSVIVSIELSEIEDWMGFRVFRQEEDGSLTELKCSRNGQVISFESEHFSIFTLVITNILGEDSSEDSSENDNTGDEKKDITTKNEQNDNELSGESSRDESTNDESTSDESANNETTSDETTSDETTTDETTSDETTKSENPDSGKDDVIDNEDKKKVKTVKIVIVVTVTLVVIFSIIGYEMYRNDKRKRMYGK